MKESLCNFRRRDCVLKPVSFFLNYNRHIQNIVSISMYIEVKIEKLSDTRDKAHIHAATAPSQGVREKARVFETLNFFGKGLTQIETDVQLL